MKKFSFRLEPVLKQREMKEEKAILVFSAAQKEYLQRKQLLSEVAASLDRATGESPEGPGVCEIINQALYIDYLNKYMIQCETAVTKAGRVLEEKRTIMIDARKDRMVIDRLKQNQFTEHMDNLNSMEQKALDEMGTVQYSRKRV